MSVLSFLQSKDWVTFSHTITRLKATRRLANQSQRETKQKFVTVLKFEWMLIVLVRRKLYDQISRLRTPQPGVRRWSHPCYFVTLTENLSFDVLHCYYST